MTSQMLIWSRLRPRLTARVRGSVVVGDRPTGREFDADPVTDSGRNVVGHSGSLRWARAGPRSGRTGPAPASQSVSAVGDCRGCFGRGRRGTGRGVQSPPRACQELSLPQWGHGLCVSDADAARRRAPRFGPAPVPPDHHAGVRLGCRERSSKWTETPRGFCWSAAAGMPRLRRCHHGLQWHTIHEAVENNGVSCETRSKNCWIINA